MLNKLSIFLFCARECLPVRECLKQAIFCEKLDGFTGVSMAVRNACPSVTADVFWQIKTIIVRVRALVLARFCMRGKVK